MIFIASRAACTVPDSPTGGLVKCMTGSATPKNIKPMPIPAENSMANQLRLRYSGSLWSGPSLMSPYRLIARNTALIRINATARM
ncbi:hypothetical protein D3C85_1641530 [compost metagenome]